MNCKDHTPLDLPQQITAKKINKRMTKGNYHDSLKKTFTKCALKHLDIKNDQEFTLEWSFKDCA